jgi:glutathione S-transferase
MKLYSYPAAPNPRRLHIFMAEKDLDIPFEPVDLMNGGQFAPAFVALNPMSTVPVLVADDGTVLTQVVAICDYLEALHPERPLLGSSALEKGEIREWSTRIFNEGLMAVAEAFRNSNPNFANRSVPGPLALAQEPVLVERGLKRLELFWSTLDARLEGRDFVVGSSYTMADIDALCTCDFARWIRKSIPAECTNILRWYAAVSARPSAKAG